MESWLYNPELAMMSWRLQVLAMHQQFQHQALPAPFVPFHLQPGPEYSVAAHLPQFPQRCQACGLGFVHRATAFV